MRFRDRQAAGLVLVDPVTTLIAESGLEPDRLQVLALPRGGVPVARPIADALGVRLRILLVRKVGLPGHPELAMGAIAALGGRLVEVDNPEVLTAYGIDRQTWERVEARERQELQRRTERFAGFLATDPADAPVLLVDDGLATGATMRAAVTALRAAGAGPILAAVPVASRQALEDLTADGILTVCLTTPDPLIAVGAAFRDFSQLTDDEVLDLLQSGG